MSGANFAAHATVRVSYRGAFLGSGVTDGSGALMAPIPITLPADASGPTSIVVMDDRSRYPVTISLTVN